MLSNIYIGVVRLIWIYTSLYQYTIYPQTPKSLYTSYTYYTYHRGLIKNENKMQQMRFGMGNKKWVYVCVLSELYAKSKKRGVQWKQYRSIR